MENQHKYHPAPTPAPPYNTVNTANTPMASTTSKSSSSSGHKLFLLWIIALSQIAILAVAVVILVFQAKLHKRLSGYDGNWFSDMHDHTASIQNYLSDIHGDEVRTHDILINGFKGNYA